MDKLNGYVKAGIFVDKDHDGFTKAEQQALGAEFNKLHQERGDLVDFKKMLAGKSFDYKNEEFVRLAKAAGYVLADEKKPTEKVVETKPKEIEVEKVKPEENKPQEVKPEKAEPQKTKTEEVHTEPTKQQDNVAEMNKNLEKIKSDWSDEERLHSGETMRNKLGKLSIEIEDLKKDYTTETVKKHRFLRKAKTEKVKVPKSAEQVAADNKKAEEKMAEYDKLAQLSSVNELYSTLHPNKYAAEDGDKVIEYIVTSEDGQKYGAITKSVSTYNKRYGFFTTKQVPEYYPITLRNRNEGKENTYPEYYYRVAEDAKPIQDEVKLAKNE